MQRIVIEHTFDVLSLLCLLILVAHRDLTPVPAVLNGEKKSVHIHLCRIRTFHYTHPQSFHPVISLSIYEHFFSIFL